MEQEPMRERAAAVLGAWNSQDVDRVLACYTEDCIYRDPIRGARSWDTRLCADT
jgi:ketosteroid isomerase-like protein